MKLQEIVFNAVRLLRSPLLGEYPEIAHGFTTRACGVSSGAFSSLNLSYGNGDEREAVARNRDIACDALAIPRDKLATIHQVLGADVVEMERKSDYHAKAKADAMFTATDDLYLMTLSADCLLILIYAPDKGIVANAHASWRGTVGEIAAKTVAAIKERYGVDPSRIVAALSPCIGPCCFEVRDDVAEIFAERIPYASAYAERRDGKTFFDLRRINIHQLTAAGVREESVDTTNLCTKCNPDLFYSYRRDGAETGRFGAVIGLRGKAQPVVR